MLLIADDVWTADAAQAFRVTGPRGRVVYTSRSADLMMAIGAAAHRVDVLSPAAARDLAAGVLGFAPPAEADALFAAVNCTPLGVALLAAAVAGGRSWAELAADLSEDYYGDHPSADAFKAMQAAVGALPGELVDALFELAVFPARTVVPVSAVAHLWARTRGRTAAATEVDLDRLAAAGVLERQADTIGFHDLRHDFLVLHAPPLAGLHAALLAAYRSGLAAEPSPWWRLPDGEPYVFDHLVTHLSGTGDRAALAAAVTDPAYLARRIAAAGVHGADADLAAAERLLPDDEAVSWLRGWVGRHAHLLADDGLAAPPVVPATLRAWLQADVEAPRHGVDPARLDPLLGGPRLDVRWGLAAHPSPLIRVLRSEKPLWCAAWSPDRTRLATGCTDGSVLLWDRSSWEQVGTLSNHGAATRSLAWSPDGAELFVGDETGHVRRWNPETGSATLLPHRLPDRMDVLAWSPDGTRLFAGSSFARRLDDALSGASVWDGGGPDAVDRATTWTFNGAALAAARVTGITTWHLDTGARHVAFPARRSRPGLAWSPDCSRLAVGDRDGIWFCSPESRDDLPVVSLGAPPRRLVWSPRGTRLVAFGPELGDTVRIVGPSSGTQTALLTGHGWEVRAAAWATVPAGDAGGDGGGDVGGLLAVVGEHLVRVWDVAVAEGTELRAPGNGAACVAWSANGAGLAAGRAGSGLVELYDPGTGRRIGDGAGIAGAETLRFSADGRWLAVRDGDTIVVRGPTGHRRSFAASRASAWSPDGAQLATGGTDGIVRLWRTGSWLLAGEFGPVNGPIAALSWSLVDDRVAVATLGEFGVTFWESTTGRQVGILPGDLGAVAPMAWSPDGRYLAITRGDGAVLLWDVATGGVVDMLRDRPRLVEGIAWSPNSDLLAIADRDGVLAVQSLTEPRRQTRLRMEALHDVAWTSAGLAVASAAGVVVFDVR